MHDARLFRRVVPWLLVAAIGLPPSPAAAAAGRDPWERVTALKPETHLMVAVAGPPVADGVSGDDLSVLEGWLVSGDASGLVLRHTDSTWTKATVKHIQSGQPAISREAMYTGSSEIVISRERVVQVAVVKEGSSWYAIPLVVAAFVGGVAICVGTIWAMGESGTSGLPSGDDSACGPFTFFVLPFIMGVWAYRKTDDIRRSEKVIYVAPVRSELLDGKHAPHPEGEVAGKGADEHVVATLSGRHE
jgi:hypothetical protein